MNVGHVEGGTHAGWKRQKQPVAWTHYCIAAWPDKPGQRVTLTAYSCADCGERRP